MFCVYLTCYTGNKLPPFYIGSTSLKKLESGYFGSITSTKYKVIFKKEIKNNPQLFKTKVISLHHDRQEALQKENSLQRKLNVVSSSMYFNESFASINGFYGRDSSGELSGMFGKKHSENSKQKMRKPKSEETKQKMRKPKSIITKQKMSKNNAMHSIENRKKISESRIGRKGLYKEGVGRKMIFPNSDLWKKLINDGYQPKA